MARVNYYSGLLIFPTTHRNLHGSLNSADGNSMLIVLEFSVHLSKQAHHTEVQVDESGEAYVQKHVCISLPLATFHILKKVWLSFNLNAYADRVHSFNFVKSLCSFSIADFEIIASLNQRALQTNPISLQVSYCRSSLCMPYGKHWTHVLWFKKSSITYVQKISNTKGPSI